jgi:hypothetical protein
MGEEYPHFHRRRRRNKLRILRWMEVTRFVAQSGVVVEDRSLVALEDLSID